MYYEIKLPKRIQLAGLRIGIKNGDRVTRELKEKRAFGIFEYTEKERYFIKLDPTVGKRKFSETTCHEFLEAINTIYLDNALKHREINGIGKGLHQILEQLKVRFVE